MSGHSKWSTIKRKKAANDQARGKVFSKLVREITQAVKLGGPDPDSNARLRLAIQKSKEANVPSDNVKRAIQKGAGDGDDGLMEEILFEAYGPAGVALLIATLTDNKTRTISNLKAMLTRATGTMATKGAVAYLFDRKGTFIFEPGQSVDPIMEIAIESGADDVIMHPDTSIEVITPLTEFDSVRQAFDNNRIPYANADLQYIAQTTIKITDVSSAEKLLRLIEKIEDDDDVQAVFGNYEIDGSVFEQLE